MCRFTHPLAAIGTMSWPRFAVQPPVGALLAGPSGSLWNRLMAETANLEASIGRDCRKGLRLQLTVTHSVINWHEPTGVPRSGDGSEAPRIATATCVRSAS